MHDRRYPGESPAYRTARDALLVAEVELRKRLEDVARLRRALPPGGVVPEDYVFEEADGAGGTRRTRLSELFRPGKDTLVVYSFMFGPEWENACPMCTSFLDSLDGSAPHLAQRIDLAVVAEAPLARIREWADGRGWRRLRLLSAHGNGYNRAYFGEDPAGEPIPYMNVFRRRDGRIEHFYGTEMLFVPPESGQNNRHIDLMWPLWNVLDLTPEGRGETWYPRVRYEEA
jgi:predicted dithiol-disulfide oxidoreductase (DUF899 family)